MPLADPDEIVSAITQSYQRRNNPWEPIFGEDDDYDMDRDVSEDRPEDEALVRPFDWFSNDDDWWTDGENDEDFKFNEIDTFVDIAQSLDANPAFSQQMKSAEQTAPGSQRQQVRDTNFNARRWMANHENGRIPDGALDPIGGGHQLRADAAVAYKAMRRAAKRDGVSWGITDSYRTYDAQVACVAAKGLYSEGGLCAEPGTSNHGWGLATDLDVGPEAQAWLRKHGDEFGFQTIPREPWHWEYEGGYKPGKNAFREDVKKRVVSKKKRKVTLGGRDFYDPGAGVISPVVSFASLGAGLFGSPRGHGRRKDVGHRIDGRPDGEAGSVPKFVPKKYRKFFLEAAERTGLDPTLLALVAQKESGFNAEAVSSAGAQGIMQVMPLHGLRDPSNPRKNILKGAQILASYIQRWNGDLLKGLASYNAGPGNYSAGLDYARDILEDFR